MRLMARQIEVMHQRDNGMGAPWGAIDAQPQLATFERKSLDDYVHFAPAHTRTEQIIIPKPNVSELMDHILELQQDARIERIKAEVREGEHLSFIDKHKFEAQIISLAA